MNYETFYGTINDDVINTLDLQLSYPYVTEGFDVYGLAGNDFLISSFAGRNGLDRIYGEDGDDSFGLTPSYLNPETNTFNSAYFYGGHGRDTLFITDDGSPDEYTYGDFTISTNNYIQFIVDRGNQPTLASVEPTVEIINLNGINYLTEDIFSGRIRRLDAELSADLEELDIRTSNANSDWYANGLDTYSAYHSPQRVDSQIDLGMINKNEIRVIVGTNQQNKLFDYFFEVEDELGIFTYFSLYDLQDDLDLNLYQFSPDENEYIRIAKSENPGTEEEIMGKFLPKGNYILEVSYYEEILGNSQSNYEFSIDTQSLYDTTLLPNDEYFADQWYLFNIGQAGGYDNNDIYAPEAWKIRSTSPDVIVAVIDGGIQSDHPDLINNIWVNELEIPENNIDDDGNGYVDDINGWNFAYNNNFPLPDPHGTHVAGIIGAEGNNSFGVAGVTWDVQLMSLDVFGNESYASDEDIWEGMYYAVDNGAKVINMSLGSVFYGTYQEYVNEDFYTDLGYRNALDYAINNGVTVVIAAGNEELN